MRSHLVLWLLLTLVTSATAAPASPSAPHMEGAKAFIARPQFGAAVFNLPATVRWKSLAIPDGRYHVTLEADIDASQVLANIKPLSARALDRNIACGDLVKVQSAAAKLIGPRAMLYDLRFHYAKHICAGIVADWPADVTCAARIAVSAARSIITIDVQGRTNPPCQIVGAYPGVSEAVYGVLGIDVFKRHTLDLARLLPRAFQGMAINIATLGIEMPPAAPVMHVAGESTMSNAQFAAFMARLDAAAPAATN